MATNATTGGDLQKRLDAVERALAAQQASLARGNSMTLVVGVIILCLLGGYFYYGYTKIAEVLEPKTLVDSVEGIVQQNLPEVRKVLQNEIVKSAPKMAEQLSAKGLEAVPQAREKLEGYVVDQIDKMVVEGREKTDAEFKDFVKKNKIMLNDGVKQLVKSPEDAKKFLNQLIAVMEEQQAGDLKADAEHVLLTITELNGKLATLREGKGLKPDQALEREILAIAKRLQMQEGDPNLRIRTVPDPSTQPKGETDSATPASSPANGKSADSKPDKKG